MGLITVIVPNTPVWFQVMAFQNDQFLLKIQIVQGSPDSNSSSLKASGYSVKTAANTVIKKVLAESQSNRPQTAIFSYIVSHSKSNVLSSNTAYLNRSSRHERSSKSSNWSSVGGNGKISSNWYLMQRSIVMESALCSKQNCDVYLVIKLVGDRIGAKVRYSLVERVFPVAHSCDFRADGNVLYKCLRPRCRYHLSHSGLGRSRSRIFSILLIQNSRKISQSSSDGRERCGPKFSQSSQNSERRRRTKVSDIQ